MVGKIYILAKKQWASFLQTEPSPGLRKALCPCLSGDRVSTEGFNLLLSSQAPPSSAYKVSSVVWPAGELDL